MTKDELLAHEATAWDMLASVVSSVPADRRSEEGVVPGWSAHDVLWHVAFWAAWGAAEIDAVRKGEPEIPEREDDEAWEAEILAEGREKDWDQLVADLTTNRTRARVAFEAFDGEIPEGAQEWFEDETFSHYREHAEQIAEYFA